MAIFRKKSAFLTMMIENQLATRRSKEESASFARTIAQDQSSFLELWKVIRNGAPPLPQRGAWILEMALEHKPAWLSIIYDEAVDLLFTDQHDAVYRHLIKCLSMQSVPEKHQGRLYDLCIQNLLDPQKPVAVQVFSMSLAARIALPLPELQEELAIVIREGMEWGSAGFRSRGKKVLKELGMP